MESTLTDDEFPEIEVLHGLVTVRCVRMVGVVAKLMRDVDIQPFSCSKIVIDGTSPPRFRITHTEVDDDITTEQIGDESLREDAEDTEKSSFGRKLDEEKLGELKGDEDVTAGFSDVPKAIDARIHFDYVNDLAEAKEDGMNCHCVWLAYRQDQSTSDILFSGLILMESENEHIMRLATTFLLLVLSFAGTAFSQAQAPANAGAGAPISSQDRIYTGDQSSNTITVIDPETNAVLGTISLGSSRLSDVIGPQYIRSVNSHGLGFSRDGKYIVSTSVTSNTVTVVRTQDNSIVSQTFTDRQPHEAFFAVDNRTIWVGTRGVDHVSIVDGLEGGVTETITSYGGPSKVLFSPDGATAYVNHIRSPYIHVIDVSSRATIANITGLAHPFSSDMMLSADGQRLWVAHKMLGAISIISTTTRRVISILPTGPETNHPNFAVINSTTHAFVTVAGEDATKVYRQPSAEQPPAYISTIASSGVEPHGLWPSADNTRLYVVNEHSDTVDVVDLTAPSLPVIRTLRVGQEGQALIYVSGAVPPGADATTNLGAQGLDGRVPVVNKVVRVDGHANASALVTVRPEVGLDMFQVVGRSLRLNATYEVSAACVGCSGVRIPLLEFTASMPVPGEDGCATAPQVLGFFKFNGVYDVDSLQVYEK
ncbi:hypothetical protein SLS56_011420 [Neofusicoccum ribis]|uniref:Uncharacterized protein n=1 Tax=Neofusicoccum ribis TaxID=45134 RepID=A0ABR3SCC4_9PEZI